MVASFYKLPPGRCIPCCSPFEHKRATIPTEFSFFLYISITNLSLLRDQFLHFFSYHPLNLTTGFDEVIAVVVTHL